MYAGSYQLKIIGLFIFGIFLLSPIYAKDNVLDKDHIQLRNQVASVLNLQSQIKNHAVGNEVQSWQQKITSSINANQLIDAREVLDFQAPKGEWQYFARYNLAVAFVNKKQYNNAIDQLVEIVKSDVKSPDINVLKDQANYVLGLAYLKTARPEKAQRTFNTIALRSSEANKLLLDIGRVWYQQGDNEKALIAWLGLFQRDAIDQDVQRALVAVPSTLVKIGRSSLAMEYYTKANARYDLLVVELDRTIKLVRAGELLTSLQSLLVATSSETLDQGLFSPSPLIESISTPYLYNLYSAPNFTRSLQLYREFHFYRDALKDKLQNLTKREQDIKQQRKKRLAFGKDLSKEEMQNEIISLQTNINKLSKKLAKVSAQKGSKKQQAKLLDYLDQAETRVTTLQIRLDMPVGEKLESLAELKMEISTVAKQKKSIQVLRSKLKSSIVRLEKELVALALDELDSQRRELLRLQQFARLAQARLADEMLATELSFQTSLKNKSNN